MRYLFVFLFLFTVFSCKSDNSSNGETTVICAEGRFIDDGFQVNTSTKKVLEGTVIQTDKNGDAGRHYVIEGYHDSDMFYIDFFEPLEIDPTLGALNGCDFD